MDVHEFLEKFNSMSEKEKTSFLAFLHGSLQFLDSNKNIMNDSFEFALKK